jgi:transcription elongation GreA/GreB family factor
MATAQQAMDLAQESANTEEKSSAGDKYETGRAMGHLQKDMHARQLAESVKELAALHAAPGTVVEAEQTTFFIGAGLGRQTVEGKEVFFLSPQAPLARVLLGKNVGETIALQKATMVVRDIY